MSQLPPLLRDQRKIDADHLKLLAVFHFVGFCLSLLGLLFLFAHYTMMNTVFSNPQMWQNQQQPPPPKEFFEVFMWFYLGAGIWFIGSGLLNLMSALFMRARKFRVFSLIVAGLNCMHVPLGTVLGVFTIMVLIRDSVQDLYESPRNGYDEGR